MASGCHTGQGRTKGEKNLEKFFLTHTLSSTITCAANCMLETERHEGEGDESLPALRQVRMKETDR